MKIIHQNLFITLLLGSKAKTVLTKQLCCSQTKMYRLYRKNDHYCGQQKCIDYVEKLPLMLPIKRHRLGRKMTINVANKNV